MNTSNSNNYLQSDAKIVDHSKLIGDNIHKSIRVHPSILKIIQTPEFQRLHNIKQLGLCFYVFPCAKHSRFEHSLGAYYLACQLVNNIRKKYPDREYKIDELGITTKLTDDVALCILIAAVCHDIGHGPYSHNFDDVLLRDSNHPNRTHEVRSCLLTETICRRELGLDDPHIAFTKSVMNPDHNNPSHKGALYQIVSNELNGMDVDKYDYLNRDSYNLRLNKEFDPTRLLEEFIIDSNGNIAYSKHCSQDVLEMFDTRYKMFSIVYCHKTNKLIEEMYNDIMIKVDPIFKISESINDMNRFYKVTDSTVFDLIDNVLNPMPYMKFEFNEEQMTAIRKAAVIKHRILRRDLYKSIFHQNDVDEKQVETFIETVLTKIPELTKADFKIKRNRIGYVSGNKPDPFMSIYFYDKNNDTQTFILDKTRISGLKNSSYRETKYILILKRSEYCEQVRQLWKDYYKVIVDMRSVIDKQHETDAQLVRQISEPASGWVRMAHVESTIWAINDKK